MNVDSNSLPEHQPLPQQPQSQLNPQQHQHQQQQPRTTLIPTASLGPRTLHRIRHALRRLPPLPSSLSPAEAPRTKEQWEMEFGRYEPAMRMIVDRFERGGI